MHSHFAISEWSHVYSPIWQLTEASKGLSVELSSVRLRGATGTGEIINPTGFELLRELEQRIPCSIKSRLRVFGTIIIKRNVFLKKLSVEKK